MCSFRAARYLVVGRDVEEMRQFGDHHPPLALSRARHRPRARPRRRHADEPQFPAPRRCHHRRQPLDHGGRSVAAACRSPARATSSTGLSVGLNADARPDRAPDGRHEGGLEQCRPRSAHAPDASAHPSRIGSARHRRRQPHGPRGAIREADSASHHLQCAALHRPHRGGPGARGPAPRRTDRASSRKSPSSIAPLAEEGGGTSS